MDFEEFWPHYLRAHSRPLTRGLHVAGTIAGTGLVVSGMALRKPWLILGGLAAGYGPAWLSHAVVERNKPETFRAPFASLAADFVMAWHVLRGTIDAEISKNGSPYHR